MECIDPDYYKDICERADYYGMESLTEEEQIILNNFDKEIPTLLIKER